MAQISKTIMHPKLPISAEANSYSRKPIFPPQLRKLSCMEVIYCDKQARKAELHIMMNIQLMNHL